jgi:hypothetical protein
VQVVAHSWPPASLVVFLISAPSRAGASIAVALSVSRSGRLGRARSGRLASAVTVTVVTVYYLSRRSHSLTAIYEQSSPLRPFDVLVLCLLLLFLPPSTRSDVAAAHTQFAYIALERPAPSLRLRAMPMCVCVSHSVPSIMMCCANSAVCALVVQSVLSATSTRTRD